jgi:Txe/YoeB family toxin of toxin-antitoxin system
MFQVYFTKQALKDRKLIAQAGLEGRARALLAVLAENPFQNPPPYEKLVGDLSGYYSRRINLQHRLVYAVYPDQNAVKILRMWTHYA